MMRDIVVIGAGPAGLSCAIEARREGLSCLVVDKGNVVDSIARFQRDMFFFSTPELLEIGGVPFVIPTVRPTSLDCVNYYRRAAETNGVEFSLFHPVAEIRRRNSHFVVAGDGKSPLEARAVVVATGYYDTPNPLGVPGEDLSHVTHYYTDPLPWYRRDVLIVGGKNSAVEAALDLWRHGARVTVVHRGETLSGNVKYWILPDFQNRVSDGSITVHYRSVVREFRAGHAVIAQDGRAFDVKADGVFVLIGYRPDVRFLRSTGMKIDEETLAPVHDPESMETSVRNLFVAGGLVGGKFNNKVFIENGRGHGKKIVAALKKSL